MSARLKSAFFSVLRAVPASGPPRRALWGWLSGALSDDEKSRLGVAMYDAGDQYRDAPRYEWEDAWLARRLPAPVIEGRPSRVLVGAAGAGREVRALIDRGHDVVAMEPSAQLAAMCRERTGGRAEVIEIRYEEFSDFICGAGSISQGDRVRALEKALSPVLHASPFDAVLLGLGSLSHVLDAAARARLFEALTRVCPRGPILASTLAAPCGRTVVEAQHEGRATKLGRALAAPIRAARRLPAIEAGEIPFDTLGFAKIFARAEMEALGAACDRRTIFEDGAPDGMFLCAFVRAIE